MVKHPTFDGKDLFMYILDTKKHQMLPNLYKHRQDNEWIKVAINKILSNAGCNGARAGASLSKLISDGEDEGGWGAGGQCRCKCRYKMSVLSRVEDEAE